MTLTKILLTMTLIMLPAVPYAHADHMAPAGGSAAHSAAHDTVRLKALVISGASVRAMLPGAKVGGGGLTIQNTGTDDDRLIAIESPAAGRVEMHDMIMDGDVMKMREIEEGIAILAGETVSLKGSGRHLMFMNVGTPFSAGETVALTLTFEKAGQVTVSVPVGNAVGR